MTGWSSNLAANRLLRLVGDGSESLGVQRVEATLARLGATSSRYPGAYRIGTSVDEQPPLATGRVTTARDLGRALYAIAAAAAGDRGAARRTGLDEVAARYALGLLLESERSGVNAGLVAGALPPGTPIAQKNGWITDVRDTAAIVYGPRGPRIVVVLAYRPGLTSAAATALGRQVVRAAFRGLGETQLCPSRHAARPDASSSSLRYDRGSLRPSLGTSIAPRRTSGVPKAP